MMSRRLFLAVPAALAACGAPPPPPPPVLDLTISAGADQNPDPAGHPAPVAVRLYQLSDTARFDQADLFALVTHEQETLGSDLLGSEEFVVAPGTSRTITRTLASGTRFVGIAVLFRDVDHAEWRATARVASDGATDLTLTISGLQATLSSGSG